MSPRAPAIPARAGSVRHAACLCPSASIGVREPALRVFDHDPADRPDPPLRDLVAGLLDHRVAGVVVGHGEHGAVLGHGAGQPLGLRAVVHHRLVDDDVEARLDTGQGRLEVRVVGRDDRHEVDPFLRRPGALALDQLLPARVGALGRQQQVPRRGERLVAGARQRAGRQLHEPVQRRRAAVDGADERVPAAADLGVAEPASDRGDGLYATHGRDGIPRTLCRGKAVGSTRG